MPDQLPQQPEPICRSGVRIVKRGELPPPNIFAGSCKVCGAEVEAPENLAFHVRWASFFSRLVGLPNVRRGGVYCPTPGCNSVILMEEVDAASRAT